MDKSKIQENLKMNEEEIRETLEMYFDYICNEFAPSKRIQEITVGKIFDKKVVGSEQTIAFSVTNIFFQQYNPKADEKSCERNQSEEVTRRRGYRSPDKLGRKTPKKTSKRQASTTDKAYGKDFRIGDIIDFT